MRACTCGRRSTPCERASAARSSWRRHAFGSATFWVSTNDTGRPHRRAQAAHPVDLPLGRGQVLAQRARRGELEHARAQLAEHRSDAEQLVLGGEGARHRLAVDGAVGQRARGREAERPGADPLAHDGRHRLDVGRRRGLVAGTPLPHHVGPHRAVGHLGPDVEGVGPGLDGVEVLGERLPAPLDALAQRRAGDVLDTLHQPDEPLVAIRGDGREAHPAVAHHDRGDAVPARRREQVVPRGLAVVVRVHVDEPGGDQRAVGVELASGRPVDVADLGDDPVRDGDVGGADRGTGAVGDRPPADDQIVHGIATLRLRAGSGRRRRRRRAPGRCRPPPSARATRSATTPSRGSGRDPRRRRWHRASRPPGHRRRRRPGPARASSGPAGTPTGSPPRRSRARRSPRRAAPAGVRASGSPRSRRGRSPPPQPPVARRSAPPPAPGGAGPAAPGSAHPSRRPSPTPGPVPCRAVRRARPAPGTRRTAEGSGRRPARARRRRAGNGRGGFA